MAQEANPNYPIRLHIGNTGNQYGYSSTTEQPITERPPMPTEIGYHVCVSTQTQPTGTRTASPTDAATSSPLTAANLAKKNGRFDPGMEAVQIAARVRALQKAGKELGFDLPAQNYMKDPQDLACWLAQQSK